MREIEVKIFNIDAPALEQRLKGAGASLVFDGDIYAVHVDYQNFRLRSEGKSARIRRIGDKAEIVIKGRRGGGGVSNREEIETYIGDFETMRLILNRLGLVEMCRYRKHRRSYSLDGIKFEFDTFKNFPTYVEVEARTEDDVGRGVAFLGVEMKDTYSKSIMARLAELNTHPQEIGFELSAHYDSWRQAK